LNALLVFFIFRALTGSLFVSLTGALLFVSSPFHTEAVTYISGRADLISGLFILSAYLLYLKNQKIAALLFFIFALLSKEHAFIFPILLISSDLFLNKEIKKNLPRTILVRGLPFYFLFFLIDILYLILRLVIFSTSPVPFYLFPAAKIGFVPKLLTFLKNMVIYLKIMILPIDLHMERKTEILNTFFNFYLLAFLIILIAFVYFVPRYKNKRRLLLFGLSWFLIMLFPQSSFFLPFILAEHFLYLPSIGIFLIIAIGLENLKQRRKAFTYAILSIWILFYSFLTIIHNLNWKGMLEFSRWTAKLSPHSSKMHYLLGIQYAEYGLIDMAINEYRLAIQSDLSFRPNKLGKEIIEKFYKKDIKRLAVLYHNLGVLLSEKGLWEEAEEVYLKAITVDPKRLEAYNDLGCLYIKRGELRRAEDMLNKALKVNPLFAKAYYNLGVIYAENKEIKKAIAFWQEALKIDPKYELVKESLKKIKSGE
jgi:tetratricopeptide (TPR) repeat protein